MIYLAEEVTKYTTLHVFFLKEKHPREIERLYSFVDTEVLTFNQNTWRHI